MDKFILLHIGYSFVSRVSISDLSIPNYLMVQRGKLQFDMLNLNTSFRQSQKLQLFLHVRIAFLPDYDHCNHFDGRHRDLEKCFDIDQVCV